MYKESLIELLRADGSITVNKNMSNVLGLETTVLYSELLSKYRYFKKHNQLSDDGYFFSTVIDLEYSTSLSKKKQLKCIKTLQSIGLVEVDLRGLPAKRYFKINLDDKTLNNLSYIIELGKEIAEKRKKRLELTNEKDKERLLKYLENKKQSKTSCCIESEHLDVANRSVNNTNTNNTNIIKEIYKEKSEDNNYVEIAEELYKQYPRKKGKQQGIKKVCKYLKDGTYTKEQILNAINNYKQEINKNNTEEKYIKHFSTFMNNIEDYNMIEETKKEVKKDIKKERKYSLAHIKEKMLDSSLTEKERDYWRDLYAKY